MEMEPLDRAPCFIDDLLNFGSDLGEEDEEEEKLKAALSSFSTQTNPDNLGRTFPDYAEEELEWLSNKDAFPSLETFVDIYATSSHAAPKQDNSPVSVLENVKSFSSFCASVRRARSKCCRKRRPGGFPELTSQQRRPGMKSNNDTACLKMTKLPSAGGPIGRRCWHCQADKTPQWRAGPAGPKTLCNACGVRYKSGRLVPEYRPARSPTFSDELHSNSHRKIMEMRRLKVMGNMTVNSG